MHYRSKAGRCAICCRSIPPRHASFLANAGMSLPAIGALLGHASPATTQRYVHLADSALRVGVEALGQVVAGPGIASLTAAALQSQSGRP